MKTILLFICFITLLTTGCFFPGGRGGHGGGWHDRRGQVDVAAPVVAVSRPAVIVAPAAVPTPPAPREGTIGVIAP